MLKICHRYLSTLLLLIFISPIACAATGEISRDVENLLSRLDSALLIHENLVNKKEIRLDGLRNIYRNAKSDVEKFGASRQLYDEYLVYDSDSALYYADITKKLLDRIAPDNYDQLVDWVLNQAFIYTVQGRFDHALKLFSGIDTSRLSPEIKAKYFGNISYAYSMHAVYLNGNQDNWNKEIAIANSYRDSLQNLNIPINDQWLWVPVSEAIDEENKDITGLDITGLKQVVDNNTTPSRQNAINAYWLARYYEATGDTDLMLRYMTLAAIYDVLIVNREIAALQELATLLFEQGHINRAYNYLLYTVEQANVYHNRYRMVSLSDALPQVRNAYLAEIEKRDKRLSILVTVLAALTVVLIISFVFIVLEFFRLKKTRNLLKIANTELNGSIEQRDEAIKNLEKTNADLIEANKQKLGILAYAFKLTTQYINALDDYRKKLLRKYKTRHIDDLGVLLNDPELTKEQFQDFYESFDKTVLSLFPDFVDEYNMGVSDENKVSASRIAQTKILNTKLRIHALRRLGVSKSADIAQMLNVSIRTVYNNRNNTSLGGDEDDE